MPFDQTIDFLEGNLGLWILWICVPLWFVSKLKKHELLGGGWRKTAKAICSPLLIGLSLSSLIMCGLAVVQRLPPQYFIRMRVTNEKVILAFYWPKKDLVIPINELRQVRIKREGRRRITRRVCVETAAGEFLSYGFHRLNDDQMATLEKLTLTVETNQRSNPISSPQ